MKIELCPLGHGKLQRMYSRKSEGLVNSWKKTKYWYCPVCQATYNEASLHAIGDSKKNGCDINKQKEQPVGSGSIQVTIEPDVYMKLQLHDCCGFGMSDVIDTILWKADAYNKHSKQIKNLEACMREKKKTMKIDYD